MSSTVKLTTALLIFCFAATFAPAQTTTTTVDDPLLNAMRQELDRSKAGLKLADSASPYYIEYSVIDSDRYKVDGSFGAITGRQRTHTRVLSVVVRTGDYKQDNSFGQGMSLVDLMPEDNDAYAMRHTLWLATDHAYKAALRALAAKQAMLRKFQDNDPVDDFSKETPSVHIGNTVALELGKEDWPVVVKHLSGLYRQDPLLDSFNAGVEFLAENVYFANSEGSISRKGHLLYEIRVHGTTQSSDGMTLRSGYSEITPTLGELPDKAKLHAKTQEVLDRLKMLRAASAVKDDYQGPVLFEPEAAAVAVNDVVANNVLGLKPAPGSSARTSSEYGENYKSRILPANVTVIDDPTMASFKNEGLISNYAVDDEGVAAQPVTVVDKGELVNYLTSRQPIRGFEHSNGHGRLQYSFMGLSARATASTVVISSSQPVTKDELKKKLIAMCKEDNLPYGYMVKYMGASQPQNEEEGGEEGFAPTLLYRISASDGHEDLVRGAQLSGLDTRALRNDLVALGDDPTPEAMGTQTPVTVIAPSMLIRNLEIKGSEASNDKLPQYPAPPLTAN